MHIKIDGMMSGTGIRDATNGGYLEPEKLGLSPVLQTRIASWLQSYELEHFNGFSDEDNLTALDLEGMNIMAEVRNELPENKYEYYSNAKLKVLR